LICLLNQCQHFPGFVYQKARLCPDSLSIEIDVRPRRGSKPVCSGCHRRGTAYDLLNLRRFEFIPIWDFAVLLLYHMRRIDCRTCGVGVEELPWAIGKHQQTNRECGLHLSEGRPWRTPSICRADEIPISAIVVRSPVAARAGTTKLS
jgi:hypothetical protein